MAQKLPDLDEFIAQAKQTIYERATEKGLKFEASHIIHVKDNGHDVVYLKDFTEKVLDEASGEIVEKDQALIFMEFRESEFVGIGGGKYALEPPPKVVIIYPELVAVRYPDGGIKL